MLLGNLGQDQAQALVLNDRGLVHLGPLVEGAIGQIDTIVEGMKEIRLSGIDTIEAGNAFLPSFMAKYNARFAKAPFDDR